MWDQDEWRRRTEFPRDSRTPVLTGTLAGLTSVFGMGTGVNPAAMAALTPICGIEPQPGWVSNIGRNNRVYVQSSLRLNPNQRISVSKYGMNGGFNLLVLVD